MKNLSWTSCLPENLQAGRRRLGLWLPDVAKALPLDPRYAVRLANRDVPWWTDGDDCYGINLLGVVEVLA